MRRAILSLAMLITSSSLAAQTIAEEQVSLNHARQEAAAAMRRYQHYDTAASHATDTAEKARVQAAAIAARIQQSEANIAAARARIAIIERLRASQRRALAARQQPIIRLTAALQNMARRPPALALVQPGSLTDLVHTRLLLNATLPLIRERTADLRADVDRGTRLRQQADLAVTGLRKQQAVFAERRIALARLEAQERARSRSLGNSAFLEQERAQGMAEKARDIVELMNQMDQQAQVADRLASLPAPLMRPPRPGEQAAPPSSNSLRGATAAVRPAYRLPVLGRVVTGMGEVSETGVRSRGLTFITRPGAQVIAPAGGQIRFAQGFRGYGLIVIIDHGSGWTTLITGLDSISVIVGDTVVQGSPVGRTGNDNSKITVELRRGGQPIDIAPLAVRG